MFFQFVSSRYERASLIVISNKPLGRWGDLFASDVVAAAIIDRLAYRADVICLNGDSSRLKDRDLHRVPAAEKIDDQRPRGLTLNRRAGVSLQPPFDGQPRTMEC